MDEMNDSEISRQIDRDVAGGPRLVALTACFAVILGILVAGAIVLIRQFS